MRSFILAGTLALATSLLLTAAPAAVAAPVEIGERNPSGGREAPRETRIIAKTGRDTYGTRQSNLGAGGGAIYGCRSILDLAGIADPARSTPCIRVNNLRGGKAFDFVFDEGPLGGIIQAGASLLTPRPNAVPFVTNATGIAAGLNADRVDNLNAQQIVDQARVRDGLDADKVDGFDAAQIVAASQSGGLACEQGLVVAGDACIETAARPAATFAAASAACGTAGRHLPNASLLMYARTLNGVDLGGGEMASDVSVADPVVGGPESAYATVADDGTTESATLETPAPYRCAQG